MLRVPGFKWGRLGAHSGGCGRGTLASKVRRKKPSEERECWTGPQPTRPAPRCAWSCGDKGAPGAREMEMVWGKCAAPSWGGTPRGCSKQGPSSTSTHTHTCWATSSDHLGASSSPRAPGGPNHGHMYTHTYICAHRHTSRTPAPAGAPSLAENPLQRLNDQQHGHTTRGPIKQQNIAGCDIRRLGHTNAISCPKTGVSRPQFAR